MCIKAVRAVLETSIVPPTLKLTAVVLAYRLNDQTRLLNPSIATVADDVGVTRGQAQRYVRTLIDMGLLSVIANANGGKPGVTPHYHLHLDRINDMARPDVLAKRERDSASATPTDSTSATPRAPQTGGMDAEEGWHTRRGGVAPMHETGSTHATQKGIKGNEPEENRFSLQADAFNDIDLQAQASTTSKTASKGKTKPEAVTASTWEAYSAAFRGRYGIEPIRDAQTNTSLKRFIGRVGATDAPEIAAFYVAHPRPYYTDNSHSVAVLVRDVETLRTQWKTGRVEVGSHARSTGRTNFEARNYRDDVETKRVTTL